MSDHLVDMASDARQVVIDGKQYTITTLRISDYALAATKMQASRKSPAEVLREMWPTLDPETRTEVAKAAYVDMRAANMPTTDEVERWFATPAGMLYQWWLRFRRHQPDFTEALIEELLGAGLLQLGEPAAIPTDEAE